MRQRIFTSVAAASAIAATVLITSPASAADPAPAPGPAFSTTNTAPQSAGVTPESGLPPAVQIASQGVDPTQYTIVASLRGVGKQVYDCGTNGAFPPASREPEAALFTSRGIPTAIHGKGPFWAAFDGSHVDGAKVAQADSPDPTRNIPWLLLKGTPNPGPDVQTGLFSHVAFIQRIDTRGGVAPTGSCTAPKTVAVDYTANYVFWAKR